MNIFLFEFDEKWNVFCVMFISVHPALWWWMCINNFHFPKNTNLSYACEKHVVKNQGKNPSLPPKETTNQPQRQYCWVRSQTGYSSQSSAGQVLKPSIIILIGKAQLELSIQPFVIYKKISLGGLWADNTEWFYKILFSYTTLCKRFVIKDFPVNMPARRSVQRKQMVF